MTESVGNCCSCGYVGEMCVGRHVTKCPNCWKIMRTCGKCAAGASYETMRTIMGFYTVFVAAFMVLYLRYAPHASPLRLGTVSAAGVMLGCLSAIGIITYKAKVGRMVPVYVWRRYDQTTGMPVLVAETTHELSSSQIKTLHVPTTPSLAPTDLPEPGVPTMNLLELDRRIPENAALPAPRGGQ